MTKIRSCTDTAKGSDAPEQLSPAALVERLRFLSSGFVEGSETERVMWQAAAALEARISDTAPTPENECRRVLQIIADAQVVIHGKYIENQAAVLSASQSLRDQPHELVRLDR
jgi:hypothetical protein